MPQPTFKISTEGSSRTTVLSLIDPVHGAIPIARFYAGRFDAELLKIIEAKLNA